MSDRRVSQRLKLATTLFEIISSENTDTVGLAVSLVWKHCSLCSYYRGRVDGCWKLRLKVDEISPLSQPLRLEGHLMSCQNDFKVRECVWVVLMFVSYQLARLQSRGRRSSVYAPNIVKAAVVSVCVLFKTRCVSSVWWFGKQLVRRVLTHRCGPGLWEIRHPCVFVFVREGVSVCVCVCVGPLVWLVMPLSPS